MQATAALVARLALGNSGFQRYLRLEEVLVRLVPAMAASADALTLKGEDHDLLVRATPRCVLCAVCCVLPYWRSMLKQLDIHCICWVPRYR